MPEASICSNEAFLFVEPSVVVTGSKAVVRMVITLIASVDWNVAMALPAYTGRLNVSGPRMSVTSESIWLSINADTRGKRFFPKAVAGARICVKLLANSAMKPAMFSGK